MSDFHAREAGLLFRLSGADGAAADFSMGEGEPTFFHDVEIFDDETMGKAFRCGKEQLFAYRAPGNAYAQRGTLSFFWRSRYPVGPTEFPIFRIGYSDHSSWDAVWLRIDYNGRGLDAFVTDINLSRTRVSCAIDPFPPPERWMHVAFSWDENVGVRLYVDGRTVAAADARAVYFAGLDQFGTHSRIISHWSVQSTFNYIRGGDVAEIHIYDHMLCDDGVAALSRREEPRPLSPVVRDVLLEPWRGEWLKRYGFDSPNPPPLLPCRTSVRKVEIHEARDHKRWWWKATDGIRETSWPGVYNRSRLPGRLDYFILPDWDCYSVSGEEITFYLPDEPCNYLEISGSAHGDLTIAESGVALSRRQSGFDRTFHPLGWELRGAAIRFVNDEREEPIGDFSAFYLKTGGEPEGGASQTFALTAYPSTDAGRFDATLGFIAGRYMADERFILFGAVPGETSGAASADFAPALPFVHIALPYERRRDIGLDGVALEFPPSFTRSNRTSRALFNVQVKDPLWIHRNLVNFSFRLSSGEATILWLDTRDRILPEDGVLYLTIASSEPFPPGFLASLIVRLRFKSVEEAKPEHVADRFIQVKDNYSHLVEEYPRSEKYSLYRRFMADLGDLLSAAPDHALGRLYRYDFLKVDKPPFVQSAVPAGVPRWAFRQAEYLRLLKRLLSWWIDERQIPNGEFGGGLSDDGDLTSWWPGPALVGCMPEKIKASLLSEMEAFFANGMFTNGLCTIQTDQLHTFEEGIQTLGQCLVLDEGNPLHLERAMETARAVQALTAVNSRGHRHFFSAYYSGTRIAREYPWNFSNPDSYLVLHPAFMLARYNGNPALRAFILELADSLLAHYRDGKIHSVVDFDTDEDAYTAKDREWPLFIAAYDFTGDEKYLKPLKPEHSCAARNLKAIDAEEAANRYEVLIEAARLREYINTEGHLWVDRVVFDISRIQVDRIGGIAHQRFACYPRHFLSWRFEEPATDESVAVLVPYAAKDRLKIVAFNLEDRTVAAVMAGADVAPGIWRLTQGIDADGDGEIDSVVHAEEDEFGRGVPLRLVFPPRVTSIVSMELIAEGLPYAKRPDLGIGPGDVWSENGSVRVRVHSLGGAPSPETRIVIKERSGTIVSEAVVPPLPAPVDLKPKIAVVELTAGNGVPDRNEVPVGATVEIDPDGITAWVCRTNKRCALDGRL